MAHMVLSCLKNVSRNSAFQKPGRFPSPFVADRPVTKFLNNCMMKTMKIERMPLIVSLVRDKSGLEIQSLWEDN